MEYNCKKLFNGYASVRDFAVKACQKKREPLIIRYNNSRMTVPLIELLKDFQIHKTKFHSKFSDKEYELYDFLYVPDGSQMELF